MNTDTEALRSTIGQKKIVQRAIDETKRAYGDCWIEENQAHERNLQYLCTVILSVPSAIKVFKAAGVNRYNYFRPEAMKKLPKDSRIRIGREFSPVIYAEMNELWNDDYLADLKKRMQATEFDLWQTPGTRYIYRIWFD